MEIAQENENNVKFLVPEIVRRSKNVAVVKKSSKHATPHVDKVYESKKKYLAKLTAQHQSLLDYCKALKQKGKSVLIKQNSTMSGLAYTLTKSHQLKEASLRLDEDYVQLVEEFEQTMQEYDNMFKQSLENYNDKNLPLLVEKKKAEMAELRVTIDALLKEPEEDCECELAQETLTLQEILMTAAITEEKYLEDLKKQEELQNELDELEKQLALLESDQTPNTA